MNTKNLLHSFILVLISTALSFAQTAPERMNYQGVARDASGNILANTQIGLQIDIRQFTSTGTAVYTETHSTTTNDFGLFNIQLGSVNATLGTIDWSNGPYFLEASMDASGGTNYVSMGTSQLVSVPYALYAETSGNGGVPGPTGPTGPQGDPASDDQTLSVNGNQLSISGGNSVTIPDDADANPTNELQTLSISNDTISLSNGGYAVLPVFGTLGNRAFYLHGERLSRIAARHLDWFDAINTGGYTVYRSVNNTWEVIATLNHDVETYIDGDLLSGDIVYKVESEDSTGVFRTSEIVTFKGTSNTTVETGYFGDGSDGAYTGGDLEKGRVYNFSSFSLDGAATLSGSGLTVIFVDGDMSIGASASFDIVPGPYNEMDPSSMSVAGNVINTTIDEFGEGGAGGDGGNGGPGYNGNCWTFYGDGGSPGSGPVLSSGGTGGAGGNGGNCGSNGQYPGPTGGVGGSGADAPVDWQHAVVIICSGNFSFLTFSEMNGQGAQGSQGQTGEDGVDGSFGCGGSAGGGGGGGSGGGSGAKVFVFYQQGLTLGGTYDGSGGLGGTGGNGGTGGVSNYSCNPSPGQDGDPGQDGQSGSSGSIEYISL